MPDTNPTVWLTLQAHNPAVLIDYLVGTFGFDLVARHGEGETVEHAELLWPEGSGGVMLGAYKPEGHWTREPGTAGGYVVTSDPDRLYERVLAAGADIIVKINETPYGSREFVVRDPEGNLWAFGTYTGAPRGGHPS
ncbi:MULTISPECIES: VOC family protein [Protofrankia]|uniref:Glyoxalase n=1 Tax=Protofrankia coriariae TaxID=1562887 RepID=A0ABR5F0E1_9ACTN|nr:MULTISPECIES: VOC family protein [Protofrankia]KLL10174.1 glyoxalase [Protofrankia coriariae]ONH34638.1 glyoxalase [Protofrankia sp. BMG5.30]